MSDYRLAPLGFTREQWTTFNEVGLIQIENALTDDEVATYLAAIERVTQADPSYKPGDYYNLQNFVERDPVLAGLIDHPRHVGYAYDLYGEQLKLQLSELFLRTPSAVTYNKWHPDGARNGVAG